MLLLVAGALWIMASQRTPAEATAHARDELANCVAQGKCLTATPSPSRTPTPAPTATPLPTSTPLPDSPTPAPEPTARALLAPDQPVVGYLRPSLLQDGTSLELALPALLGRWDVRLTDDGCGVAAWSMVVFGPGARLAPLDSPGTACGLIGASWRSDVPCAEDESGTCQLDLDASYWDWLGQQPPAPAPVVAEPLAPTPAPTPAPRLAPVQAAPAPQTIVQQVIVTASPTPTLDVPAGTDAPEPTPTPAPTMQAPMGSDELTHPRLLSPTPTPPVPWWLANATATALAQLTPTPEPTEDVAAPPDDPSPDDAGGPGLALPGLSGLLQGLLGLAGMVASWLPLGVLGGSVGLPVAAPVLAVIGVVRQAHGEVIA